MRCGSDTRTKIAITYFPALRYHVILLWNCQIYICPLLRWNFLFEWLNKNQLCDAVSSRWDILCTWLENTNKQTYQISLIVVKMKTTDSEPKPNIEFNSRISEHEMTGFFSLCWLAFSQDIKCQIVSLNFWCVCRQFKCFGKLYKSFIQVQYFLFLCNGA